MSAHTPAPWRLDDEIHGALIQNDYHFVDSGSGCSYGGGFGLSAVISIENAMLIAAAPDMLAVLEQIVEVANVLERESGGCGVPALAAARAAIAKATGGRP